MRDPNFIDEQRNADYLDAMADKYADIAGGFIEAMADRAHELEEAMREAEESEFTLIEEHYNDYQD